MGTIYDTVYSLRDMNAARFENILRSARSKYLAGGALPEHILMAKKQPRSDKELRKMSERGIFIRCRSSWMRAETL